jgi:hypothetical protein
MQNGVQSSNSESCEIAGRDAAWIEFVAVCGDLVGGSCRRMTENSEWSLELLDAANATMFRMRLTADSPDKAASVGDVQVPIIVEIESTCRAS